MKLRLTPRIVRMTGTEDFFQLFPSYDAFENKNKFPLVRKEMREGFITLLPRVEPNKLLLHGLLLKRMFLSA